jgi:hypothetical protein
MHWLIRVGTVCALLAAIDSRCRSEERSPARRPGDKTGVVLMKSGRVLKGEIHQNADGYVVSQINGHLVVPFSQVKLVATDLAQAYQKLRKVMPYDTSDEHFKLARWCLLHGLYNETRDELRAALLLNDANETARRMLQRLEEILEPGRVAPLPVTPRRRLTADGFEPAAVQSLAGLSRENAIQFVRKIQPLLMNKCGNAYCHGQRASNDFRLVRVRAGRASHRVYSERNLTTLLKYIDMKNPDKSPILVKPLRAHGPAGRTIFFGSGGKLQVRNLKNWVRTMARENAGDNDDAVTTKRSRDVFEANVSIRHNDEGGHSTPTSGQEQNQSPRPRQFPLSGKNEDDDRINRSLRHKRPDVFDPSVFNQQSRTMRPTKRNQDVPSPAMD